MGTLAPLKSGRIWLLISRLWLELATLALISVSGLLTQPLPIMSPNACCSVIHRMKHRMKQRAFHPSAGFTTFEQATTK